MPLDLVWRIEDPRWSRAVYGYRAEAARMLEAGLSGARFPGARREFEVSLVLANAGFVRPLNRDYRGKDKATNVLSFPQHDFVHARQSGNKISLPKETGAKLKGREKILLGDLVLCYEVMVDEAKQQGKTLRSHYAHLVLHGFLHLLGYTHEHDDDARVMESLERRVLRKFGYPDPYAEER